ncbi:MAG: hypothetical protein AABZ06_03965 [Bdellovibrionota bacterium]
MSKHKRIIISCLSALFVISGFAYLNITQKSTDCIAFQGMNGFAHTRGWPFISWANANADGLALINASVVLGGTKAYTNYSSDPQYPHLAINWTLMVFNLIIAFGSMLTSIFLVYAILKRSGKLQVQNNEA